MHCITRNEIKANDSSPRLEPVDDSDASDEMPDLCDDPNSSDDDLDSATMNTGAGKFWYTKCPDARQAPDERLLEDDGDCPSGHARARTNPQPHHLGTAMHLRGDPVPDNHHPSPPPPEPRLIEVVPDSWENISDEHIHPQVAPSQQPAEYMAGSHTNIPIMHCENSSPQDGPNISLQRLAKLWLTDKEASVDDWVLLHHRGFKRLWECDLKSSKNTRWSDASPVQRANFSVSAGRFAKKLTKCRSHDRVFLRLSGGWEQFLRNSLQISVSLWSSPPPTVEFSMSPLLPDGMGSLSGPLDQQILRALGKGEQWTQFFIRSDLCCVPETEVFDCLDQWVRSDSRCRFVILLDRSSSPEWSKWVESWVLAGRSKVLCSLPKIKVRSYDGISERWHWYHRPWELLIVDCGTRPVGEDLPVHDLREILTRLCKRPKGTVLLHDSPLVCPGADNGSAPFDLRPPPLPFAHWGVNSTTPVGNLSSPMVHTNLSNNETHESPL